MPPLGLEAKLIAYAVAAAVALGALAWFVHHEREIGASAIRAAAAEASAKAQAAAQVETARRLSAQAEASHEADKFNAQAAADARSATDADGRLRERIAARGRAAADPAVAGASSSAGGALVVPADVFGQFDEAAGRFAGYADQLRGALDACVASYGALTP